MSSSAVVRLWLILALSATTAAGAVEGVREVPRQFRGVWAATLADCANDFSDTQMVVTANRLRSVVSEGLVKAAAINGDLDLAIILEVSAEGELFMQALQLKLSKDHRELTVYPAGASGTTRVR
jgi:hypothetical protein